MLLAPRPPLSRTKGSLLSPPPSTSCALTTPDTGHKSGLRYVRHRETVQQRNAFLFFSSFLYLSTLFSGETPVILPVMTPVEDRSIIYISERGKNPKWRTGEKEEEGAHIAACTTAAVCGADRESLLGFAVYYFFFPGLSI